MIDLGLASNGNSVALQPNGQIVAAGLVATSLIGMEFRLTQGFATERLNTDGSLDTSFGTGGAVVTQVLNNDYYSVAVGLETINSQTMIVNAGTAVVIAAPRCLPSRATRQTGPWTVAGTPTATLPLGAARHFIDSDRIYRDCFQWFTRRSVAVIDLDRTDRICRGRSHHDSRLRVRHPGAR